MEYMKRAIELAKMGEGKVNPNPLVGAVIVKNGKIIGEGFHRYFGGPHAEIDAINNATESVEGADIYVTLEPCSHYGKTPPCALALVKHKFNSVFIGTKDPNPLVAGKGIKILEDAGIHVFCGICEQECIKLNEVFLKYIETKLPFVVMKTGVTLDGKIATVTGESQWITDEKSREYVHKLRNSLSGIMVGVNTVIADNPKLTSRIEGGRNPIRIITDSTLRTPENSNVLDISTGRCIIAVSEKADSEKCRRFEEKGIEIIKVGKNQVDLKELMKILGNMGIDSILIEGGGELNFSALKEGIVDKVITVIAPKILGGKEAKTSVMGKGIEHISDAVELSDITVKNIFNDTVITGYVKKKQ